MDENQNEEKVKSYILIQFSGVGSAILGTKVENITPEQMMLAADILGVLGKNAFIQKENAEQERREQQKLAIPNPGILTSRR
jgi:hypothetical protein